MPRLEDVLRVAARARIPYYNSAAMMKSPQGKYIVAYYGANNIYFSLHWADSMKFIKPLPADEEHKCRGREDWEIV